MFGDLNKAEIMGNITHDLELRHTSSGTPVCSFRVATNRRYQVEGEWREETEFHNVVLWAQRAESFVQRAKKGTRLYVEGRLQTRSWEDENGVKHYRTEIIAARVILLDRYEKPEGEFMGDEEVEEGTEKSEAKSSVARKKSKSTKKTTDEEEIDPDDLPF